MITPKKKKLKKEGNRYQTYNYNNDYTVYYHVLNSSNTPKHIGICEGIETGLSIMQLNKELNLTMYCLLGTSNMSKFIIGRETLGKVKSITIYGDNDTAGEKASRGVYNNLVLIKQAFGLECKVKTEKPNITGDYNDYLLTIKLGQNGK